MNAEYICVDSFRRLKIVDISRIKVNPDGPEACPSGRVDFKVVVSIIRDIIVHHQKDDEY
ncbi:MAG: hypothetical protein OXF60_01835 [Gammaproteobacteria bacterium]|nr:hypothetical protein [Gammaproteobacteria bacterium]